MIELCELPKRNKKNIYICERKKGKNQRKKEEIFSFPYDINLERDDRVSNNSTFVRVSYAYRILCLHREKYSRNREKSTFLPDDRICLLFVSFSP